MMPYTRLLIAALIVALAAMSVGSASAGSPPTFTVTVNDDPAPNGCTTGACSLREAIIASNESAGTNTIIIPELDIALSITGTDDTAAKGDLDITDSVTITGAGPDLTNINAAQIDGVIDIPSPQPDVASTAAVNIIGVAISGGSHSGIHNTGALTLDNVVVFGNSSSGNGGGIDSPLGSLLIDHSTIGKNTAENKGGGIASHRATTIRNSTIWVNNGLGGVGGIWADGGLTLENSTVHRNTSGAGTGPGGILIEAAPSTISNSTIADNMASAGVGGVWNSFTTVTMTNTIISGNTMNSAGSDCLGVFAGDNNLVKDPTLGCNLTGANNITGQDPMLLDLSSYGGLTQTRAIPKNSPARDHGASVCQAADQRGIPRPQAGGCDIGAYEYMFLGDVDCSGFATTADVTAYLGWLILGEQPACFYRGDLQCNLDFGVTDVLYLLDALAGAPLPPPTRPVWCGEIGPFTS